VRTALLCLLLALTSNPGGTPPRRAARQDARLFAQMSNGDVQATMERFNLALGVTCEHCHVNERWLDDSKPPLATARQMVRMVAALNQDALRDIGEVACWTCHEGQRQPSRQPRPAMDAELARWPTELDAPSEGQKITMSVYNVALGVTCNHCHTTKWAEVEKPAMKVAIRMNAMFAEFPKYMPAGARTQCWMCHKGTTKPKLKPPQ
jgi:hypothetical protein